MATFFILFIFAVDFIMKQIVFLFIFVCFYASTWAQKNVSYDKEKEIYFIEQQYIDAWKKIKKMDGFRIQITSFAGVNSKTSIERAASQFAQQFPDIPYYKSYLEPNFRLRAGNYRTKIEAYRALQKISQTFPGSFVLKDQVDFMK